jgi:hypothetical protein
MKQEMIIGVAIAITVVVLFGIKTVLHSLVNFKMDESAILKFLNASTDNYMFRSTRAISTGTDLSMARVAAVCIKSKAISANPKEKESWCLKPAG